MFIARINVHIDVRINTYIELGSMKSLTPNDNQSSLREGNNYAVKTAPRDPRFRVNETVSSPKIKMPEGDI